MREDPLAGPAIAAPEDRAKAEQPCEKERVHELYMATGADRAMRSVWRIAPRGRLEDEVRSRRAR